MMSCRLLVCLVFGLALQTTIVESFRIGGLANNNDGNIMQAFSPGRFHRVSRGIGWNGENRYLKRFLHEKEDGKMSIRIIQPFLGQTRRRQYFGHITHPLLTRSFDSGSIFYVL